MKLRILEFAAWIEVDVAISLCVCACVCVCVCACTCVYEGTWEMGVVYMLVCVCFRLVAHAVTNHLTDEYSCLHKNLPLSLHVAVSRN